MLPFTFEDAILLVFYDFVVLKYFQGMVRREACIVLMNQGCFVPPLISS